MIKTNQKSWSCWQLLLKMTPGSVTVLISLFLLSESAISASQHSSNPIAPNPIADKSLVPNQLAQPSRIIAQNPKRDRAEQLLKQAEEVQKRQTAAAYRQAIALYEEAVQFYRQIGDRLDQASTLAKIATTYGYLGDRPKYLSYNIQYYELQLADEKDPKEAVQVLEQMQNLYLRFGESQKALAVLDKVLKIQQQIKNPVGEAKTLRDIASIYQNLGESQKSLDIYNQALSIQKQAADPAGQAETLSSIAQLYRRLGDYDFSLDTYNQALQLARQVNDRKLQAGVLADIGMTYRDAKDYDKALEALQQALVLARSLPDDKFFSPNYERDFSEIPIQIDLSFIYEKLRDYPKALAAAQRSLELSHGVDFESGPGYAFLLMSNVYLAQKEYQQALNASSQALQTFRQKLTLGSMDAIALSNMGKAYAGLKQYPKAIEIYSSALERMRKRGDRQGEARTLYLTAVTERDRGNLKAARTNIEAGLAIVEDLRTKVVDPQLRTSYFASVQEYYQFYIDLLMQLHKQQPKQGFDALALQASERARARSLLELLNEAHADIRQGVDPKLLEQEKTLQQQFSSLEKRRIQVLSGNPTPEQAAALDQDYKALQNQYQQNQEQIRRTSPRYAALTQAQPLTLAEIQQQVLDDNTLLLVYSLGNDRSYLWAVTKTGMSSYVLPKQEDISKLAKQVYSLFTDKRHDFVKAELDQASAQLSQILLSPVTSQLGQKRLVVIADGALQYLPFTALPIPQGTGKTGTSAAPLLTQHELINLPSASTLAILRRDTQGRKSAPKTVAVMADPVFSKDDPRLKAPSKGTAQETLMRSTLTRSATQTGVSFSRLENTRLEAEAIAKLVPADQQRSDLGFAANLTNATSPQLSQYRMVHFATHGLLNSETPELSGVVLSLVTEKGGTENGFLRLQEIFNLNLPADLVVLSACKTGLGKEIQGEGLIGLTRGFMYAGAPRVVVSLWNVDDKATALLMSEFYRGMLEKRLTPAVALRQAQQSLMQQSEYRAPYYWAAFTLQGEWK